MADENDVSMLRLLIGERIPEEGDESDTLFTDDELSGMIDRAGSVDLAQGEAWIAKAAQYADLVDTIEGSSRRAMSDLHKAALKMVELHTGSGTEAPKVTRIHKIVRS